MRQIQVPWTNSEVIYFDETDSTNTQAKIYAENGSPHGTLFTADCQSAGKGRRGRSWTAAAGCNIYMSLLLRRKDCNDRSAYADPCDGSECCRSHPGSVQCRDKD